MFGREGETETEKNIMNDIFPGQSKQHISLMPKGTDKIAPICNLWSYFSAYA